MVCLWRSHEEMGEFRQYVRRVSRFDSLKAENQSHNAAVMYVYACADQLKAAWTLGCPENEIAD